MRARAASWSPDSPTPSTKENRDMGFLTNTAEDNKKRDVAAGHYGTTAIYHDGHVWVPSWKHTCRCADIIIMAMIVEDEERGDAACSECGAPAYRGLVRKSHG